MYFCPYCDDAFALKRTQKRSDFAGFTDFSFFLPQEEKACNGSLQHAVTYLVKIEVELSNRFYTEARLGSKYCLKQL